MCKVNVCIAGIIIFFAFISPSFCESILEPFTYSENFETGELSAWSSYPLWQDTAYDPNFRPNTIVHGDPNISIEQKVTPYTNVDNYAGAMKKLDMYFISSSTLSLRYYLKTHLSVENFIIRFASGSDEKVNVTIANPPTNHWEWVTVTLDDIVRENPRLSGKDRIKVNAIAVLTKIPDADPAIPFYLGLDDVVFKGAREVAFQFIEPRVYKLSEWKPYIPENHYFKGSTFSLRGNWPLRADRVTLDIVSFTDRSKKVLSANLDKKGNEWALKALKLTFDEGLYLATLSAYNGSGKLSDTEFTIYIEPKNIGGVHPRLWFNTEKKKWILARLNSERFKSVAEEMRSNAKSSREKVPLDKVVFDIDQFPKEDWIPTLTAWSVDRIGAWRDAIVRNSLVYSFFGDKEAGDYAKNLFLTISKFPYWLHPWMVNRGQNIYYPLGEMGMDLAVGYDLLYDLMSENERVIVRNAMMKNIVIGCHKGYVEDNLVTTNTSNWIAHITGGSLMCQAAMCGDGPDVSQVEPYFTGVIFKDYALIQHSIDRDGAYGEGYSYYNFSMLSWSKSLPALENVFNVDLSGKINGSYKELIWAGLIKDKQFFYFGDSGGQMVPLTNWAWLLPKYRDPLLGWLYHHLKDGETFMDVLYETADVPRDDPFDENPVRLFRNVGTTVFKSGWEKDDFVFVMRTGPFYNHQHADQGTFYIADHGAIFTDERHNSGYYADPLYQPWYTQPIAHSTILIDHNHQSQRIGDLLDDVEGFDDYAYMTHFLDGKNASFSSGDIGRLYWGKVKSMSRNVLYLKPNAVLMLDTIYPEKRDVDVTLLYQTEHLNDIVSGSKQSTITKGETKLYLYHLSPEQCEVTAVETPHYFGTLLYQKQLEKEGMLTVTARTSGNPLVMANLLTTKQGEKPEVITTPGDGCVYGTINGLPFAYASRPGSLYKVDTFTTDALAMSYEGNNLFVAMCTMLTHDGITMLASEEPVTAEVSPETRTVKYYHSRETRVKIGIPEKPQFLMVNGEKVVSFTYDMTAKTIELTLPQGEGVITYK